MRISYLTKGNYNFPPENNDIFLYKDVFQKMTSSADKGDFKIIVLRGVLALSSKDDLFQRRIIGPTFRPYGDNIDFFQPKLGAFLLGKGSKWGNYKLIPLYLLSKCIKAKTYKKSLNLLWEERSGRYLFDDEDI